MSDATLPTTQADAAEGPPVVEQRSRNDHPDTVVDEPVDPPAAEAPAAEAPAPPEADVEAQPADERRVLRPEWRLLAILMTVGVMLFTIAIRLRLLNGAPAGDEPAYLVISQTLQK